MTATPEQYRSTQKLLDQNPSMRWDGKLGFYSSGVAVMTITWSFDETSAEYQIKIKPDGTMDHKPK